MSVFWAIPPMLLGGTAAAAGIGLINAVGNLGGFFGPSIMGTLRDATGGYTGGLLVLAGSLALEAILVLSLRLAHRSRASATGRRRARTRSTRAGLIAAAQPGTVNPLIADSSEAELRPESNIRHHPRPTSPRIFAVPPLPRKARRPAQPRSRCRRARRRAHRVRRDHAVPLRRQRVPLPHHRSTSSRCCSAGSAAFPATPLGDPQPRAVVRPRDGSGAAAAPPRVPVRDDAAVRRSARRRGHGSRAARDRRRRSASRSILYLKSEDGFGGDLEAGLDAVGRLMADGVAVAIKYAVVRDDARAGRVSRRPAAARRQGPGGQRHGRAAGDRASARLRARAASPPDPAASRRRRAARCCPGLRRGSAGPRPRRSASASCRSRTCGTRGARRASCTTPPSWPASRRPGRFRPSCQPLDQRRLDQLAPVARELAAGAWHEPTAQAAAGAAQLPLVRQGRSPLVRPSLARQAGRLQPRRSRRQAGHRDPEHLERRQPVPHATSGSAPRRSSAASGRPAGSRWRSRSSRSARPS